MIGIAALHRELHALLGQSELFRILVVIDGFKDHEVHRITVVEQFEAVKIRTEARGD